MYKRIKNKKIHQIKKNHKFTRKIDFNTVWSKLIAMTKLNHFFKKSIPNWDK